MFRSKKRPTIRTLQNSCREPYQEPCQEPCQILWWEPIGNLLRNLNGNWYLEFLGVALGTLWTWNLGNTIRKPCWERLETSGNLSTTLLGTPDPEPFHEPKIGNPVGRGVCCEPHTELNGSFSRTFSLVGNCIRNPIGHSGNISPSLSGTCQQPQLQSPVSELCWEP